MTECLEIRSPDACVPTVTMLLLMLRTSLKRIWQIRLSRVDTDFILYLPIHAVRAMWPISPCQTSDVYIRTFQPLWPPSHSPVASEHTNSIQIPFTFCSTLEHSNCPHCANHRCSFVPLLYLGFCTVCSPSHQPLISYPPFHNTTSFLPALQIHCNHSSITTPSPQQRIFSKRPGIDRK